MTAGATFLDGSEPSTYKSCSPLSLFTEGIMMKRCGAEGGLGLHCSARCCMLLFASVNECRTAA